MYGAIKAPDKTPQERDINVTIKPICNLEIKYEQRIKIADKTLIIATEVFSETSFFRYPLYKSIVIEELETKIIEANVDIEADKTKIIIIANKSSGICVVRSVGIIKS